MEFIRTDSSSEDFKNLVAQLDRYLGLVDGDQHSYYDSFNKIDSLKNVIVVSENGEAVACGALREISPGSWEVKRMYTRPEYRGKGYAKKVLSELEKWAAELGASTCVLETGKTMSDAVELYKRNGYTVIPNYGPYIGIDNSICFRKEI